MHIVEEISVEFRESLLARVELKGVVYLRTLPTKTSGDKETEFSFRVEGTSTVKRFIMQNSRVSSLGNGMFHVRTAASDEPLPILKYSLQPRLTPLPLRVRLVQRHTGSLLSVMIQYVSNHPQKLAADKDLVPCQENFTQATTSISSPPSSSLESTGILTLNRPGEPFNGISGTCHFSLSQTNLIQLLVTPSTM